MTATADRSLARATASRAKALLAEVQAADDRIEEGRRIMNAAGDERITAIDELAELVGPSEAARRLGVSPSAVSNARARARQLHPTL